MFLLLSVFEYDRIESASKFSFLARGQLCLLIDTQAKGHKQRCLYYLVKFAIEAQRTTLLSDATYMAFVAGMEDHYLRVYAPNVLAFPT